MHCIEMILQGIFQQSIETFSVGQICQGIGIALPFDNFVFVVQNKNKGAEQGQQQTDKNIQKRFYNKFVVLGRGFRGNIKKPRCILQGNGKCLHLIFLNGS